eukprot:TRINITY_DN1273_c0_g1_i1.p1 TRINITY_DN1273_c0_g1~~TRINITY_DN1273_c0_g1_i1.p1  ORF type:complete len:115 (+),score=21.54 TRINITY_DN1273_c0_g1_i1:193-537(+)
MHEVTALAGALGIKQKMSVHERLNISRSAGRHKVSMLQDFENRKTLETAAILEVTQELATLVDVKMPTFDAVVALALLKKKVLEIIEFTNKKTFEEKKMVRSEAQIFWRTSPEK